jgi:hypothetical protein
MGGVATSEEVQVTDAHRNAGSRAMVAVLTFRRTELLPGLLAAVTAQAGTLEPPAEVLVVDNDPAGSAREVVTGWAGDGVRYVHEPRPGISAARNRALDEARDADVLVFIDDDETPAPDWLARLTGAWQEWGCAAVAGPVPPSFPGPVDPWVLGSGVFDRPERVSGALVPGAGAGNLLVDVAQVRALALRFDERLGLTGGEDTLFTHTLVRRGGRIRWCAEAVAVEAVPEDRLTRRWARQRSFRSAGSWSRAEVLLADGATARCRLRAAVLAKAMVKVTWAGLAVLAGVLTADPAARGRGVCTAAAYLGLVAGSLGHVPDEYGRPAVPGPALRGAERVTLS